MPDEKTERDWYKFLTEGEKLPQRVRRLMGLLPSSPRCKICNAPFKGWGGSLMRRMGREQSRYNPRYCQPCEYQEPGGAVIELTMFFADVRGSTTLAEQLGAHEFSQLMNRFYVTATDALVRTDAFVDRLIGDEGAIHEGSAVTDGNGEFTFIKGAPLAGPFITATATDSDGSTSEFSRPTQSASPPLRFLSP